jgi:hypothetical protein
MSEHSHSHGLSHNELATLVAVTDKSEFYKLVNSLPTEISEEEYEASWSEYTEAKKKVAAYSIKKMVSLVKSQLPEASYIVLYEDHSHDAPHGHIEAFIDSTEHTIKLDQDWHDLSWSNEVDEIVWDIYHLAKEHFVLIDGKRRMLIKA